ncbi:MAG: glycoside hydrolase family 5 protein [Treponema sp.]|nr:glycoside hydrolase family 5 protein [Treponema sp.]
MKKLLSFFSILALFSISLFAKEPALTYNKDKAIVDTGSVKFEDIGAKETVSRMITGWNLGNTLDANNGSRAGLSSETCWSQPKTTKEMIDGLAKSGIKTIRIPVSWSNHIIDKNYTIDPKWMARVKEIVDWAIENDMYVILNSHHDVYHSNTTMPYGKGYYPSSKNYDESAAFLRNLWSQISLAFNKGYDEHLIFETLNEPRLRGTSQEWWFDASRKESLDAADVLNKFNQLIVDTIRSSKGNNANRCIMVPGLAASPNSALVKEFIIPKDKKADHLIISVHMYTPYSFAMESPGQTVFTERLKNELAQTMISLDKKFVQNGYPVVIGEYGATNKNNLEERVKWFEFFNSFARKHGMTAVLWDNGSYQVSGTDYNEKYGFYNRRNQTWYFPEILDAILKGCSNQE